VGRKKCPLPSSLPEGYARKMRQFRKNVCIYVRTMADRYDSIFVTAGIELDNAKNQAIKNEKLSAKLTAS